MTLCQNRLQEERYVDLYPSTSIATSSDRWVKETMAERPPFWLFRKASQKRQRHLGASEVGMRRARKSTDPLGGGTIQARFGVS